MTAIGQATTRGQLIPPLEDLAKADVGLQINAKPRERITRKVLQVYGYTDNYGVCPAEGVLTVLAGRETRMRSGRANSSVMSLPNGERITFFPTMERLEESLPDDLVLYKSVPLSDYEGRRQALNHT